MDGPGSRRALAAAALVAAIVAPVSARAVSGADRAGRVTFDIRLAASREARDVKLWFPYPTSDLEQAITDLRFDGDYEAVTMAREPQSGALYLYARWTKGGRERRLQVTFHARAKERRVPRLVETADPIPADVRPYLESSLWLPSDDPSVKRTAAQIVAGKSTVLARARAIYDWMVEHTRQDPRIPGCGTGDVDRALAVRSGKCADLSSVYVALARAAGVPAREVFGLRLGKRGEVDITHGHHCWAEFYLPGTGWVPVDPAEVVSILGERGHSNAEAARQREYYFGAVDEFRIVLHRGGRGLSFPEGNAEKVSYFMYPYAEVDGAPLDFCRPSSFAYTIRFEEG
jgi:transglutaminase-like putative cysteine protease